MQLLDALAAALSLVGRHGTLVAAASIFVGLAIPPLAASFKPYLGEAIVVLLMLSFLRIDPDELLPSLHEARADRHRYALGHARDARCVRKGYLLSASRSHAGPLLHDGPANVASRRSSSPAFAALIGLDVALSLAALIVCNALTPLTASVFTYVFLGAHSLLAARLGIKLFLVRWQCRAGAIIRRVAGQSLIEAQHEHIDGLNVLAVFMFAIAAMDGVPSLDGRPVAGDRADRARLRTLTCAQIAVTAACIPRVGGAPRPGHRSDLRLPEYRSDADATGLGCPRPAWFYFAMAQVPIYLMPRSCGRWRAGWRKSVNKRCTIFGATLPAVARRVIPDWLLETGNAVRSSSRRRSCPLTSPDWAKKYARLRPPVPTGFMST